MTIFGYILLQIFIRLPWVDFNLPQGLPTGIAWCQWSFLVPFFSVLAFSILVTPEGFLYLPLLFPTKKSSVKKCDRIPGSNHWWWDSRGVNSGRPMLRWQDRGRPCRLCRWCRACGLIVPSRKGWMCKLKKRDSIYCTCYWWYRYIYSYIYSIYMYIYIYIWHTYIYIYTILIYIYIYTYIRYKYTYT